MLINHSCNADTLSNLEVVYKIVSLVIIIGCFYFNTFVNHLLHRVCRDTSVSVIVVILRYNLSKLCYIDASKPDIIWKNIFRINVHVLHDTYI